MFCIFLLSLNDSYTKKYLNLRAKNIFKPKKKIIKVMQSQAKIIKVSDPY